MHAYPELQIVKDSYHHTRTLCIYMTRSSSIGNAPKKDDAEGIALGKNMLYVFCPTKDLHVHSTQYCYVTRPLSICKTSDLTRM